MLFQSAQCQLCKQSVFRVADQIAFQIRDKEIRTVNLEGREPWCGVFSVCIDCAKTLRQTLKARDS